MYKKENIVVMYNGRFFKDTIKSSLEGENYVFEQTESFQCIGDAVKYDSDVKIAVLEVLDNDSDESELLKLLDDFREIDNFKFLLILSSSRQSLGIKALNMGAADIVFMPCEPEIIKNRIKNLFTLVNLGRQVLKDPLTKLYNRTAFEDGVTFLLENMKTQCAFIMIDLDNFKHLNNMLGHSEGDKVLMKIAEGLTQTAEGKAIIGRLGGDEFAVFIPDIDSVSELMKTVEKLSHNLNFTLRKEDKELKVSGSVGIALAPVHGKSFSELYKNADTAQYVSKNMGKNKITIY